MDETLKSLADLTVNGQVESIFPTPIFWHVLKGCENLNAELAELILKKETSSTSMAKSNMGGWQSQPDFFNWRVPRVETFEEIVRCALDTATARIAGPRLSGIHFDLHGWAAVNRRGHYNTVHLHPMATWSGVYYIDPGDEPVDTPGASLEFAHPIAASTMTFFPGVLGSARLVRPVASMMLIFPSYLLHSVRVYQGDRPRICIAFNAHQQGSAR